MSDAPNPSFPPQLYNVCQPEGIPSKLLNRPQWVLWRFVQRDGKPTKVPFQTNGRPARPNDPATWSTFASVAEKAGKYDGIGYVFAEDDPYCGIDLDGCRNPQTGEIAEWAAELIRRAGTYAEVSPSGTGVKLFARGNWNGQGHNRKVDAPTVTDEKQPGIELYDSKRFFCVTGDRLPESPATIESRQEVLDWIAATYFAPRKAKTHPKRQSNGYAEKCTVLDRARKYLACIEPAISGQRGHDTTFRAACALVHGFDLPKTDALALLRDEYNPRCQPPWSEAELRHKVQSAGELPGVRGNLLAANSPPRATSVERRRSSKIDRYQPFPTEALPASIRSFVASAAKSIGCDDSFVALPVLTVLASAIGNTRRLRVKDDWHASAALWTVIVGESGTTKTLAAKAALQPIRERQRRAFAEHAEAEREFETRWMIYEKKLADWKRDKNTSGELPEKPEAPKAQRFITNDTTVEALGHVATRQSSWLAVGPR